MLYEWPVTAKKISKELKVVQGEAAQRLAVRKLTWEEMIAQDCAGVRDKRAQGQLGLEKQSAIAASDGTGKIDGRTRPFTIAKRGREYRLPGLKVGFGGVRTSNKTP